MPRPFLTDRLEAGAEGRLILISSASKGWRGRTPAAPTSSEHPGTAVRWENELWEVVLAIELLPGGARYELRRWDDQQAARHVETYDEESELRRASAHRADRRRRRGWVRALVLSPLLGHLPSALQQRIEDGTAFPATALTIVSAAPFFVFGVVSLISLLAGIAGGAGLLPTWAAVPGVYFLAESAARLSVAVSQGRPIGSLGGEAFVTLLGAFRRRGG
jgi:hypothetical protein